MLCALSFVLPGLWLLQAAPQPEPQLLLCSGNNISLLALPHAGNDEFLLLLFFGCNYLIVPSLLFTLLQSLSTAKPFKWESESPQDNGSPASHLTCTHPKGKKKIQNCVGNYNLISMPEYMSPYFCSY
jgi:hypothetical protein